MFNKSALRASGIRSNYNTAPCCMRPLIIMMLSLIIVLFPACNGPDENANESASRTAPTPVDWTVMVYLNGDNDLEQYAIDDFLEMSQVGSSDRVNIIAQFDRAPGWDDRYDDWEQTLRFRITKDMEPKKDNALEGFDAEANMGDSETLREFVKWAQATYPANRYMLIVWDHGAGWRFFRGLKINTPEASLAANIDNSLLAGRREISAITQNRPVENPVKSVSHDFTSGMSLMNREIQDNLSQVLPSPLDVIGFDACLMGMIETGYAMRGVANTMVASEELEPGTGWLHTDWARALVDNPALDGEALSRLLVDSYKTQYASQSGTTLSSVRLSSMNTLAASIDNLASALIAQLGSSSELTKIKAARTACRIYGGQPIGPSAFYNIDFRRFCEQLAGSTQNQAIRDAAQQVVQEISRQVVISNYAHSSRQGNFGSQGIAIYFPATKSQYDGDSLSSAYQDANMSYPVEFVQTHRWDNFLQEYIKKVP